MTRESVLALQQEILEELKRETEQKAFATESLVDPKPDGRLAVGYSIVGLRDYRLELRVQRRNGKAFARAEGIREQASGEAHIAVVRDIKMPSRSSIANGRSAANPRCERRLPLHPGLSVGHRDGGSGTLGAFVYQDNDVCVLSNAHVLAPQNASTGDAIYQPGGTDQKNILLVSKIGSLLNTTVTSRTARNTLDAAIAKVFFVSQIS